ncbi:hypothetical protein [Haloplanus aerogenes]|uniref:Uncharacterized protein n=1 Tax=Haloplanus aerogenes TaxID=660522 RepID=A0A3M0CTG3_9EURY|nr:hypothetical protein [Haloplanus aerogenes]AZH26571.1 hypothetical protein DU502_14845 [Haloplanus aerogenes]RMB12801.1 hypothetical protein ATH50_2955 [Haloplanus aerogenes]
MSTSTPTTDRTARQTPTLTDGKWRAETTPEPTTADPTGNATFQFLPDCDLRLYNLIDEENRAML